MYLCTLLIRKGQVLKLSEQTLNINLPRLPKEGASFSVHIDDAFFAAFDNSDVRKAEVDVNCQVLPKTDKFLLTISANGSMWLPCDRCLDLVEIPVSVEDMSVVEIGEEDCGDNLFVSEKEGILELAPVIYDILITNLPLTVRHRQGECNPEMERLLQAHLAKTEAEEPEE